MKFNTSKPTKEELEFIKMQKIWNNEITKVFRSSYLPPRALGQLYFIEK